MIFYTFEELF